MVIRRKATIICVSIAVLSVMALVTKPRIDFFILTGHFFPVHKIETLGNPIAVKGWTGAGLLLTDGRTISFPGIHSLPNVSPALTAMTERGVEMAPNGHVFGLVRIHHWCGNDPVRLHIARVDLSEAMMFLRVGQTDAPVPESASAAREAGGRFSERGWNISEYSRFLGWQCMKDSPQ